MTKPGMGGGKIEQASRQLFWSETHVLFLSLRTLGVSHPTPKNRRKKSLERVLTNEAQTFVKGGQGEDHMLLTKSRQSVDERFDRSSSNGIHPVIRTQQPSLSSLSLSLSLFWAELCTMRFYGHHHWRTNEY